MRGLERDRAVTVYGQILRFNRATMTKINRVVLSVYASRIFARSRDLPQTRNARR